MREDDRVGGGPIGILDSGVGGLAVVRSLRRALPAEDLLYLGDTAFFPYGERPHGQIRRRVVAAARWLADEGASLIVLACNTAASVATPAVRGETGLPVVGVVVPEARAAARATRSGRIGLLATEATVRSGEYVHALARLSPTARLTAVPCPGLAAAIQERPKDPAVASMVRRCCAPLLRERVDTVILGCTHYTAVAPTVGRLLPGASLIGPGTEVARDVAAALDWHGIRRTTGRPGRLALACTGDPEWFAAAARRSLGAPAPDVTRATLRRRARPPAG